MESKENLKSDTKTPVLRTAVLFFSGTACITLPVLIFDVNYALSTVLLFWAPVIFLVAVNLRWINHRNQIVPFIHVNLFIGLTALYFEYAALGVGIWGFSEHHHKLLRTVFNNPGFPYALYGAPIEEFLFWFGATPFCILLYLSFCRILEQPGKVAHELLLTAAWPVMLGPFVPFIAWLHKKIRRAGVVNGRALALTIAFFCFVMLVVEHQAVLKGHWVYAENRIWGPRIFGTIPIEELLYYSLGPLFVIFFFHFFELRPLVLLQGRKKNNDIEEIRCALMRRVTSVRSLISRIGAAAMPVASIPRGTVSEDDSEEIIVILEKLLRQRRFSEAGETVQNHIAYLLEKRPAVPETNVCALLSLLRKYALFNLVLAYTDAICAAGGALPQVRRHRSQALIELGRTAESIATLLPLREELEERLRCGADNQDALRNELGEAIGLLGRSYKQLYVDAGPVPGEPRLSNLEKSLSFYEDAWHRRLGDYLWHGVNLMALHSHAVHVQQGDRKALSAEAGRIANTIRAEIAAKEASGPLAPWDLANRIEVHLALGNRIEAVAAAGAYLAHPGTDAFAVRGTRRQLLELWGLDEAEPFGCQILPMMTARFAELGGLHEEIVLPTDNVCVYESALDATGYASIRFLLDAVAASRSVASIGPSRSAVWGTGFLVPPEWFPVQIARGHALFLTNAHICSDMPEVCGTLPQEIRPEEYTVVFTDFSISRRSKSTSVRVVRQLWTSPPSQLDATLLEIESPPSYARPLSNMGTPPEPGSARGFVNTIGYPRGLQLRVSMHHNDVVDHRGPRLYYHTSTEPGSSGSPVFDLDWNLVAIHQGAYQQRQTNGGICIDAIVAAVREESGTAVSECLRGSCG